MMKGYKPYIETTFLTILIRETFGHKNNYNIIVFTDSLKCKRLSLNANCAEMYNGTFAVKMFMLLKVPLYTAAQRRLLCTNALLLISETCGTKMLSNFFFRITSIILGI